MLLADQAAIAIRHLRGELDGRVVTPSDVGYEQLRIVFSGGVDRRPAAIVRATSAGDVSETIRVNFLSNEGAARVRAAYPGQTWDRLAVIKARYDPGNLFSLNENVLPSY